MRESEDRRHVKGRERSYYGCPLNKERERERKLSFIHKTIRAFQALALLKLQRTDTHTNKGRSFDPKKKKQRKEFCGGEEFWSEGPSSESVGDSMERNAPPVWSLPS